MCVCVFVFVCVCMCVFGGYVYVGFGVGRSFDFEERCFGGKRYGFGGRELVCGLVLVLIILG